MICRWLSISFPAPKIYLVVYLLRLRHVVNPLWPCWTATFKDFHSGGPLLRASRASTRKRCHRMTTSLNVPSRNFLGAWKNWNWNMFWNILKKNATFLGFFQKIWNEFVLRSCHTVTSESVTSHPSYRSEAEEVCPFSQWKLRANDWVWPAKKQVSGIFPIEVLLHIRVAYRYS